MNQIEEHLTDDLRVLVVSKITGLDRVIDQYGLENAKGVIEDNHENYGEYREEHEAHYWSLNKVIDALNKHNLKYDLALKQKIQSAIDPATNQISKSYNLIIPVGGDGTLLTCAHYILDKRLMFGVNSCPRELVKGPFASIGGRLKSKGSSIEEHLRQILSGETAITPYNRLRVEVHNRGVAFDYALNEVIMGKDSIKRGTKFSLKVDDFPYYENQNGNGVMVCTRSGHPAFMEQIEGSIEFPPGYEMRYLAIWSHPFPGEKFLQTSGFVNEKVEVISGRFDSEVSVDSNFTYDFKRGHRAIVTMSDKPVYMVEFEKG